LTEELVSVPLIHFYALPLQGRRHGNGSEWSCGIRCGEFLASPRKEVKAKPKGAGEALSNLIGKKCGDPKVKDYGV
jgi:hypothetical protein